MKNRLLGKTIHNWYRNLVRNPKWRWWVLLGTLLYLVSPVDILPDVFPVVGWVDDGLIATIALTELSQVLLESRRNLGQKATSVTTSDTAEEAVIDVQAVRVG